MLGLNRLQFDAHPLNGGGGWEQDMVKRINYWFLKLNTSLSEGSHKLIYMSL